jgi:hypothetical protein
VAERERQFTPGTNIKLLSTAEGEVAVLHVQIGMADAAARDPHEDFRSSGLRRVHDGLA